MQPIAGTAGSAINPAVQVAVQDASGNTVRTASTAVTLVITSATGVTGAALGGTVTQQAMNGVATFGNLIIDKAGTGYSLTASAGSLTGATSGTFAVTAGQPAKLDVTAQPTAVTAGAAITPAVQIAVQDAFGNSVTNSTTNITMAITSSTGASGAALGGTLSRAAVAGIASFNDLTIDKAAGGYTLTATATNLTAATTGTFAVSPGAAAKVAVTMNPSNVTAGAAITPAVQIGVQDAFGNSVSSATSDITVAITSGTGASGAVLGGTLTQAAVNGVATFSNLTIDRAATGYTLSTTAGNLTGAITTAFTVSPGAASKLAFAVHPSAASSATAISPALQVALQDALGNTATSSTASITLAITSGTGASGATLTGTTAQPAVNGVATFADLKIDKASSGYMLTAAATALTSATSSAFAVSPGAASKLAFTVHPSSAISATAISPAVQVTVQDAQDNTVTSSSVSIALSITTGTGATGASLSGTGTQAAVNGVATFADLKIAKASSGYTLTAAATALTSATSSAFTVSAGTAAKVGFVVQPTAVAAGSTVSSAVQVAVQDAQGNTVTGSTASVTVAITSGSGASGAVLGGTLTQAAVSGVATFNNLTIEKAASGYTLTAGAMSLMSATSDAFTVSAGAASKLAFTTQPTTVTSASAITPAVQVIVQDAFANTVTTSTASVTLAITSSTGASGAVLGGTLTQAVINGVSTFSNLTIDKAATGYTLTASEANVTSATSSAFEVTVGAASKLAFTVQPSAVAQGASISPAAQVTVQDAGGNTVNDATNSITVAIASGTGTVGAVLGGTSTQTAAGGTATFNNLTVDKPGSNYSLTATATGLANATSAPFTVSGGTISGTITLVSTLLSVPPDALLVSSKIADPNAPSMAPSLPIRQRVLPWETAPRAALMSPSTLTEQPSYVTDELILVYKRTALGMYQPPARAMTVGALRNNTATLRMHADQLAQRHGGTVVGISPAIRTVRIRLSDASIESTKASIERDPAIATVERNVIVRLSSSPASRSMLATRTLPNDPAYPGQAWHYEAIDLDYAWSITTGSSSIVVAVVDDGIRFDHPDIAGNLITDGYDFVSSQTANLCAGGTVNLAGDGGGYDSDPTIPAKYDFNALGNCYTLSTGIGGHGLHVAGTIGAVSNNGSGVAGVSWSVRIRPIRVLNSGGLGSTYDIAQGILYAAGLPADNGSGGQVQAATSARIINLSLGGATASSDLQNAVTLASANGALLVAAAGNDGVSTPMYPAAFPEVISVAAVGPDLVIASYSNYGPTIDIAAPGGDISDGGSSYGIYSTQWNFGTNSATYNYLSGTSMAAPHVSGVAALILAQNPSLTAAQLRSRLEDYSVDLGATGPDDLYGVGLLNARNSLTLSTSRTRSTRARLFDAASGAAVADATVASNGSYSFTEVLAGTYWVFAGQDEDADGEIGVAGRRWGAFGGTATPTAVAIAGAATQSASFQLGFAYELESNGTQALADVLTVGGHLLGFSSATDPDYTKIRIPTSGQYTFETQGYRGACGFALELDTVLDLYNAQGALVATNDDINFGGFNYCSRITVTLSPGLYYLRTTGYGSTLKRYYVKARAG